MKAKLKWSYKQFGKGFSPDGLVDHIIKEIKEIVAQPRELEEWIDLMFLATDGAHRVVHEYYPQLSLEEVVAVVKSAFEQKLRINKTREWEKPIRGKAIEHIRHDNEEKFSLEKALYDASTPDFIL